MLKNLYRDELTRHRVILDKFTSLIHVKEMFMS